MTIIASNSVSPGERSASYWLVVAGFGIVTLSVVGFVRLQYAMPSEFSSPLGLNVPGVGFYTRQLVGPGGPMSTLAPREFSTWFRSLLSLAWVAYMVALVAGLIGKRLPSMSCLLLWIVTVSFLVAIWCPPSLSNDVHAYVAFGRMLTFHERNPYTTSPAELSLQGDPTQNYLSYLQIPNVYGPVWMLGTTAVLRVLNGVGVWWTIVFLKLLAGTSLVAAAVCGRALVEARNPGRGDLVLAAIGFNPLLIVEGPGNGHNDILMMALLLGATVLQQRGRMLLGDLVLGLSIGIKFLPILVLPWVAFGRMRGRRPWDALRAATLSTVLILTPMILSFLPFWEGAATFSGVEQRLRWGQSPDLSPGLAASIIRAMGQWPTLVAYLGLSGWVALREDVNRRLDAWTLMAMVLIVWTMGVAFPWYLSWILIASMSSCTRVGIAASVIGLIWAAKATVVDYCG